MMTHHWRYALWLILPGLVLLVAMWTNPHVTDQYHVQRVMPFIAIDIAKTLMIVVLLIQHPGPSRGVNRWHVWRWIDPVVLVLIGTTIPSIIYYAMLVGGNSQQFRAPDWGYDIARAGMLVFGYIAIALWLELAYRGLRSRREERMRRMHRYDVQDDKKRANTDA